jgi:hypothetical protein
MFDEARFDSAEAARKHARRQLSANGSVTALFRRQ